jgi:hypothetical protein
MVTPQSRTSQWAAPPADAGLEALGQRANEAGLPRLPCSGSLVTWPRNTTSRLDETRPDPLAPRTPFPKWDSVVFPRCRTGCDGHDPVTTQHQKPRSAHRRSRFCLDHESQRFDSPGDLVFSQLRSSEAQQLLYSQTRERDGLPTAQSCIGQLP